MFQSCVFSAPTPSFSSWSQNESPPPYQVFPHQQPVFSQNQNLGINYTGLGNMDWTESGVSCSHNSNMYSDPNLYHQDLVQNQEPFTSAFGPHVNHSAFFGSQTYEQSIPTDVGSQEPWVLQDFHLDSGSGGVSMNAWSPQITDSYNHDLCSPQSQYPCPDYPQISNISPDHQMFHTKPGMTMNPTFSPESLESSFCLNQNDVVPDHLSLFNVIAQSVTPSVGQGKEEIMARIQTTISTRNSKPSKKRLQCIMCLHVFRSLSALNSHICSHGSIRSSTIIQQAEAKTPSIQTSASTTNSASGARANVQKGYRSCNVASTGGALLLYKSLMHLQDQALQSNQDQEVRPDYIPPPMLCPIRAGPGLYCSIPATMSHQRLSSWSGQDLQLEDKGLTFADEDVRILAREDRWSERGVKKAIYVNLDKNISFRCKMGSTKDGSQTFSALETLTNQARINVGKDFQAKIPSLRHFRHARCDSHNAMLLWTPWEGLNEAVNQQRITALLSMVRSSVMPGGGVSADYALQILSESKGNFLETVEKLLSKPNDIKIHTGSEDEKLL